MAPTSSSPAPLVENAVINGKYRIVRQLGAGGMGVVYAAEHLRLGEPVALKFLHPEYTGNPEIVERFLREARSQFRIKSEHVVRVLDVDTTESGAPFFVMEMLDAVSVSHLLERRTRLAGHEAAEIARQACLALAAAHSLGIVHRDIKPQNILMTTSSSGAAQLKLLDFGIAQVRELVEVQPNSPRLTRTQVVIGTPSYMAPEHLRSARAADAQSDLWSIGVMLYEMLAGELPWRGESAADLVVRQYLNTPRPLTEIAPAVPQALDAIVRRCLTVDPSARFASAEELAGALQPLARSVTSAELLGHSAPAALPGHITFQQRKIHRTDGATAYEVLEPIARPGGLMHPSPVLSSAASAPSVRTQVLANRGLSTGSVTPSALTVDPALPFTTSRRTAVLFAVAALVVVSAAVVARNLHSPATERGTPSARLASSGIGIAPVTSESAMASESGHAGLEPATSATPNTVVGTTSPPASREPGTKRSASTPARPNVLAQPGKPPSTAATSSIYTDKW